MATELDPRLVSVSIEVSGGTKTYSQPMMIKVTGTRYANALQNDAEIIIANLNKSTQDYLLTETSPFNRNRTPKLITVRAGRESYGTTLIYSGNVVVSRATQPPDIGVVLKCLTGNFLKGNIIARNQPGQATLSQIAKGVSQDLSTLLTFQAKDRNIANYTFSGGALNQVSALNALGGINAFVDNGVLFVKDGQVPLTGYTKILNAEAGMIGIPEFTEQGVRVKFLLDNKTTLGGALQITSQIYPAVNGRYVIYKLGFDIATRDVPFYYIAEAARIQ